MSRLNRSIDSNLVAKDLADKFVVDSPSEVVPFDYPQGMRPNHLVVKVRNRYLFLDHSKIQWIGSKGGVATIHLGCSYVRTRETMDDLEKRLTPPLIRVHRSAIVNLEFITEIKIKPTSDCSILMEDRTELLMSRTYRKRLRWLFKGVL